MRSCERRFHHARGAQLIALLFPGQGAQQVGMGRRSPRPTLGPAHIRGGERPPRIRSRAPLLRGAAEDLISTRNCQPAILTNSVPAWRVAAGARREGDIAMGHSLGEYSALVACGSLSFDEALQLVAGARRRDHRRRRDDPGQMAALLGASDEDVEALCIEAGEVWPANYNCPGQVVASGLHRGVDRLLDLAAPAASRRSCSTWTARSTRR